MQSDISEYYEYAICKAVLEDALSRAAKKGLTKDTDRIDYTTYPVSRRTIETLFEIRDYLSDVNGILEGLRSEISEKFKSDYQQLSKQEKSRLLEIKKNQ